MKYALYVKKNRPDAAELEKRIKKAIDPKHILDNKNPDVVIAIGGDGTFLEAVHYYLPIIDKITILPFMTGHIGFYIDFFSEDVKNINNIMEDTINIKEIPLIEAEVDKTIYYAVNEFSLGQFAHASAYDIYLDDELLESYYGSGILFSTTYGSSAYNRSIGGPLVDTSLGAFVMSKIAPITSRQYTPITAPIVFKKDKTITLQYKNRHHQTLTSDNKIIEFDYLDIIKFRVSEKVVKLHTKEKFAYIQRIRKSC